MVGYVNVAKWRTNFDGEQTKATDIPIELMEQVRPIKEMIDEAVANTSDELLEKYIK